MPIPLVIDLGDVPPKTAAGQIIHLSTPVALSLYCESEIIAVEPSEIKSGESWVRIRAHPQYLEDGILIFTHIQLHSPDSVVKIAVRASVKAGTDARLPSIQVPQDAATLMEAYDMASPNDCLLIDSGIWEAGLVLDKPIVLRAKPGAHVILRGSGRPALTVRANVGLKNLSLLGEGIDCTLLCESGKVEMTSGKITSPQGHGVQVTGTALSELTDVDISDCRGYGIELLDRASVSLTACQLHHNRQSNLRSGPETHVVALRSGFQRSKSGSGVWGQGSISIKDCSIFGNAHFGLFLEGNAQALVFGGTFDQNGRAAIRAAGTSAITIDKVRFPSGENASNVTADTGTMVVTVL